MKLYRYLCLIFLCGGCLGEGTTPTSKLETNVEFVNFCERALGDSFTWNDLQLRNTGKGPLTIQNIQLRGDEGCAFECAYKSAESNRLTPCPRESAGGNGAPVSILKGEAILVRIVYTPSSDDHSDRSAVVISTDADNVTDNGKTEWGNVVVPLCGRGVVPDTEGVTGSAFDGGVPDADAGVTNGCGDCGAVLRKGAPACDNGA